jgi:hypothetical protein
MLCWSRSGQIFGRICFELFGASCAAEIIFLPGVLVDVLGRGGAYVHAADDIAFECGRIG